MALRVLLIDDDARLAELLSGYLAQHDVVLGHARDGVTGLARLDADAFDAVLLDVMMPHMDGFTLLKHVRAHPNGAVVPFLFLSARTEPAATSQARQLGADDFLFKPFDADDLSLAVAARLERRQAVERFDTHAAHLQTVSMLANVVEARDRYTRGHVERVKTFATELAQALNWSAGALAVLEFGALLHDLGKILVPRAILNKPERLLPAEWEVLQRHPADGAQMLQGVDHLRPAIPYVLYHHEAWNGRGYPHGLAGLAIPIEGRLLAVVDAFDAMTSERPYRVAFTEAEAVAEIERQSGRQFDPEMAAAFVQVRAAAGAPAA